MRVIFPLPPLLVAGATLAGLFAPFAVGSVPTDSIGIAAVTERQFGADVATCHGSASAGVTRIMLRLAQTRTEVPQAEKCRPPRRRPLSPTQVRRCGGARRGNVQDHDRERAGAVLF